MHVNGAQSLPTKYSLDFIIIRDIPKIPFYVAGGQNPRSHETVSMLVRVPNRKLMCICFPWGWRIFVASGSPIIIFFHCDIMEELVKCLIVLLFYFHCPFMFYSVCQIVRACHLEMVCVLFCYSSRVYLVPKRKQNLFSLNNLLKK